MITINSHDAIHKFWMYRLLISIVDNSKLSKLYFKGGTCAAMAGFLDRFSVDLDFDYVGDLDELPVIKKELKLIFKELGLEIKDESQKALQFFLKYPNNNPDQRNTLKIDINFPPPQSNNYKLVELGDISRVVICQDIETMFANKLVAIIDRFERNDSIAGRDIYDVYHFFLNAYRYNSKVITERTGLNPITFFEKLELFIKDKISDKILTQDLNFLLPYDRFRKLRRTLKQDVLLFINLEIVNLKK